MQIHVQLFSILRECLPPGAERGRATITLPEGATLADLATHLSIDRYLGYEAAEVTSKAGWQVMVNGHPQQKVGHPLQDGDQIQIFPPMAGG